MIQECLEVGRESLTATAHRLLTFAWMAILMPLSQEHLVQYRIGALRGKGTCQQVLHKSREVIFGLWENPSPLS